EVVEHRLARRGKTISPQPPFPEQFIDGSGGNSSQKLPVRIGPLIGIPGLQKQGPRGDHRDQHVGVDWPLVDLVGVLCVVAGELVRVARRSGHMSEGLAVIASRDRSASFPWAT